MKTWIIHSGGVVSEIVDLSDTIVPGVDLYPKAIAAEMTDATGRQALPKVGWTTSDGGKTFSAPSTPLIDHSELKASLKSRVDLDAEALRLTLITPGSGQAMEYQEAYAEAARVHSALAADEKATFDPADYPMLAASIGYDLDPKTDMPSTDVPGEARAVAAAYQAYQKAGAAIRAARLKAKAEIDGARDAAEARKAFDAIRWPTSG